MSQKLLAESSAVVLAESGRMERDDRQNWNVESIYSTEVKTTHGGLHVHEKYWRCGAEIKRGNMMNEYKYTLICP